MKDSGFEPNHYARSLRGGSTRTIGICIQEVESPSLSRKAGELQRLFRESEYRCLLELTNRNHLLEEQVLRHFLKLKVDGIVGIGTCLSPESDLITEIETAGVPVVLVDPETKLPFPVVEVDRAGATGSILELLWQAGHRSFGFAGFDPDYTYSADRIKGANKFLSTRSLKPLWMYFESGTVRHDFHYGARLGDEICDKCSLPDAILAVNDRVAMGLIASLRRNGTSVPKDVAVVGHDNIESSSYFEPSLTTVDQQIELLMKAAQQSLIDFLKTGKKPPARITIPTVLQSRESHAEMNPPSSR